MQHADTTLQDAHRAKYPTRFKWSTKESVSEHYWAENVISSFWQDFEGTMDTNWDKNSMQHASTTTQDGTYSQVSTRNTEMSLKNECKYRVFLHLWPVQMQKIMQGKRIFSNIGKRYGEELWSSRIGNTIPMLSSYQTRNVDIKSHWTMAINLQKEFGKESLGNDWCSTCKISGTRRELKTFVSLYVYRTCQKQMDWKFYTRKMQRRFHTQLSQWLVLENHDIILSRKHYVLSPLGATPKCDNRRYVIVNFYYFHFVRPPDHFVLFLFFIHL